MKTNIVLIFFLLTSGCTTSVKNTRRITNFEAPVNCHKDIKSFFKSNSIDYTKKYRHFLKYNNPLEYTHTQRKIRKNIQTWIDISQREISIEQMSHNAHFSKIKNLFELENEYSVSASNKQMIKEVETTYFLIKYHKNQYEKLIIVLDKLYVDEKISDPVMKEIHLINDEDIYNMRILSSSLEAAKKSIIKKLENLGDQLISETYRFNEVFDNYHVTRKFLEEKSLNGNKKASTILDSLKTQDLLSDCRICKTFNLTNRPTLFEMGKVIETHNISRILYLRKLIWQEAMLTISSRLPNNYIYLFVDKLISKIPKLNSTIIRNFLRNSAIDMRDKVKHFPKIDRIIFSEASEKDLILLIANLNAQSSDNEFLTTFARRVDAHEIWNKLHSWLKNNLPENEKHQLHTLHESMEDSWTEANNRGPIAQWHAPNKSNTLRFVIDTIFLGAISYAGIETFRDEIEKVEEVTGIDLIKQQEILEASIATIDEVLIDSEIEDKLFRNLEAAEEVKSSQAIHKATTESTKTLKELFEI